MACYDTREPLEHRFKPKHYRTCVHKMYKHVLKNYHQLVFAVTSDVNTGSYTLQEGGYPCCTETNKHLERDDLTAQLDTIRKEALQDIIQKRVKKQSYCPAVRLLEKKYFMFERSSPRFTDATSKETALTSLVLASEFAFTNDWEEWVIPAMKSTVCRDCTEHFCAITQCAMEGRECLQTRLRQVTNRILHSSRHQQASLDHARQPPRRSMDKQEKSLRCSIGVGESKQPLSLLEGRKYLHAFDGDESTGCAQDHV